MRARSRCEPWCASHTAAWSEKCQQDGWVAGGWCTGCDECAASAADAPRSHRPATEWPAYRHSDTCTNGTDWRLADETIAARWRVCSRWMATWPGMPYRTDAMACEGAKATGLGLGYAAARYLGLCSERPAIYPDCAIGLPASSMATTHSVLDALGGGTLHIVGDSLSSQHFYATACYLAAPLLHASGQPRARTLVSRTPELPCHRGLHSRCVRLGIDALREDAPDGRGHTLPGMLCYTNVDRLMGVQWSEAAVLEELMAYGLLRPKELVLLNVGVHVKPDEAGRQLELVLKWLHGLKRTERPRLMWRETSPQHFRTSDGSYSRPEPNASFGTCQDDALDVYNSVTLPRLRRSRLNVSVLPVWQLTQQAAKQHGGAIIHADPRPRSLDCTHFCQQGGVLDAWSALLLSRVLRAPPGGLT